MALLVAGCLLLAGCAPEGPPTATPGLPPVAEPGAELEPVEPAPALAEGGPRLIVSNKGVVLPVLGPTGDAFRVVTT